jgi:hypothetical protein
MGHPALPRAIAGLLFPTLLILIGGCASPNKANVELRKKVQALEEQVATLKQQNGSQQQMIAGLQNSRATGGTLPAPELQKLFVAYGVKFARLTGPVDLDPQRPGDEGVRVYASPMDENGTTIQAAGSLVVEVFDLDIKDENRLGRWEFPSPDSKKLWHSLLLDGAYELMCPWQKTPIHPNLTLKVSFTDELTQATFTAQKVIQVQPPHAP